MGNQDGRKPGTCSDKPCQSIKVPTDDEVTALNAMRAIKDSARKLKRKISELTARATDQESERIVQLRLELERLSKEWKAWDKKREEAAKERMILLGHMKP